MIDWETINRLLVGVCVLSAIGGIYWLREIKRGDVMTDQIYHKERAGKQIEEFLDQCRDFRQAAELVRDGIAADSAEKIAEGMSTLNNHTDGYWGRVLLPKIDNVWQVQEDLKDNSQ